MRRRDFIAALAASALAGSWSAKAQGSVRRRPRLLIANTDPFTGLSLLKSRYAAGWRPSEDMEGWALSWQLTRQDSFAEKALAAMRATTSPQAERLRVPGLTTLAGRWHSIGFLDIRGFEPALQNRIADELMDGALGDARDSRLRRSGQLLVPQLCRALSRIARVRLRCTRWLPQAAMIVVVRGATRWQSAWPTFSKPRMSSLPKAAITNRWTTCGSRGPA